MSLVESRKTKSEAAHRLTDPLYVINHQSLVTV